MKNLLILAALLLAGCAPVAKPDPASAATKFGIDYNNGNTAGLPAAANLGGPRLLPYQRIRLTNNRGNGGGMVRAKAFTDAGYKLACLIENTGDDGVAPVTDFRAYKTQVAYVLDRVKANDVAGVGCSFAFTLSEEDAGHGAAITSAQYLAQLAAFMAVLHDPGGRLDGTVRNYIGANGGLSTTGADLLEWYHLWNLPDHNAADAFALAALGVKHGSAVNLRPNLPTSANPSAGNGTLADGAVVTDGTYLIRSSTDPKVTPYYRRLLNVRALVPAEAATGIDCQNVEWIQVDSVAFQQTLRYISSLTGGLQLCSTDMGQTDHLPTTLVNNLTVAKKLNFYVALWFGLGKFGGNTKKHACANVDPSVVCGTNYGLVNSDGVTLNPSGLAYKAFLSSGRR